MRYRIHEIKLNMNQSKDTIEEEILKRLDRSDLKIHDIKIVKESIDARRRPDIKLVYSVDFSCDEELPLNEVKNTHYEFPKVKGKTKSPVIAGFGPCGIFAALALAEAGLTPIVIERGAPIEERVADVEEFWNSGILNPESNVQFGEGGAGTFSDGKLTTGIKDIRIRKVLQEFVEAGADEAILYKQKPHIGTDCLRNVVRNLRKKIESLGGQVRFHMKLESLDIDENRQLRGINTSGGYVEADSLILAVGHSARDTFEMLYDSLLPMEQKPFSIGVRIEHRQEMIDKVQYGNPEFAKVLGPSDYKLNYKCKNGRGVYTFCMCPGGQVIDASSEKNTAVTNGMSLSRRDSQYANSGLLVDVRCEDFQSEHPLAGVEFQRKYERLAFEQGGGRIPKTSYGNFKIKKDDAVRKSLPDFASESIIEAMPYLARKLRGFDGDEAMLSAVESRSSSPVRIRRDENHESAIKGVYPAGEGAGYAGGIMSAAVDGIKTAEKAVIIL
ncbi:MAG: NAD(FAD)-utilizing dehydrogenase [Clostridiales bacterium]|nr:NAD(FAD)-utilizing dehydrogenase [Clostridiales bacterium]